MSAMAARRSFSPDALARLRANAAKAGATRAAKVAERKAARLFCSCGKRWTPRPAGASTSVQYTCPDCCRKAMLARPKEIQAAIDALAVGELMKLAK